MRGKHTVAITLGICTKNIVQTRAATAYPCSSVSATSADTDWDRRSADCSSVTSPFVAPRAKEVGKKILGNVVKTGLEVAGDVFSGKSAKEALKERGLAGIKRTFGNIVRQSPTVDDRV